MLLHCHAVHVRPTEGVLFYSAVCSVHSKHIDSYPRLSISDTHELLPDELVLNPSVLSKAIVNYGDVMIVINDKVLHNKTLKIAAIGGSITCGQSGGNHSDKPTGLKGAWPRLLQNLFDRDLGASRVLVENLCLGGVGSEFWIDRISAAHHANGTSSVGDRYIMDILKLRTTDILVLELAVNDWPLCSPETFLESPNYEMFAFGVQHKAELLISVIRAVFPHIQIIFLGISSVMEYLWNGSFPRRYDGVHAQLEVTRAHGIPHLSVMDGFGPFRSNASKVWYLTVYRSDSHAHVTGFGHEIAASLMHQFLVSHYWSEHLRVFTSEPVTNHSLIWTSQTEVDKYILSHPLHIDLVCRSWLAKRRCQEHVVDVTGWAILEDVKARPGFIATTVASSFSVLFSPEEVEKHALVGEFAVSHLNSYKDMGCFKILLQDQAMKLLNTTIVDTLWTLEESVYESSTLFFDKHTTSLNVTITIVACPSSARKRMNKVKLQSVTIR
jgi:hypothetical protein